MVTKINNMNKKILFFFLLTVQFSIAQVEIIEQYPLFKNCENAEATLQKECFYGRLLEHFNSNFKVPESASTYKGNIYALFEVDTLGKFKVLYTEAYSDDLKDETIRVFNILEKVKPVSYQGRKTFAKYSITIPIPLDRTNKISSSQELSMLNKKNNQILESKEYESIELQPYTNEIYKSNLNIPFTHADYSYFDQNINVVGTNNHTASKPYSYNEIKRYYNFEEQYNSLRLKKDSWFGRKLWNENLVAIQGKGYWFTLNPILNLNVGKDFNSENKYTYTNTRGVSVNGQLGENLSFSTSIYESQGLFADYYNNYELLVNSIGKNDEKTQWVF